MIARLSYFTRSHTSVMNALFAAYWDDDRRGLDSELVVLHVNKALLISSGPSLIPRDFDFVSDLVTFNTVGASIGDHRSI